MGRRARGQTGDAPATLGKQPVRGVTPREVQQTPQRSLLLLQPGILLGEWVKTQSNTPGEFDTISKWMQCHPPQDQYHFIGLKTKGTKQVAASPVPEAGLEGYALSQFPAPCSYPSRACRVLQHLQGHRQPLPGHPGPAHPRAQGSGSPRARQPMAVTQAGTAPLHSIQPPSTLAPLQQGRSPRSPLKPPSTTRETCCLQFLFLFFF